MFVTPMMMRLCLLVCVLGMQTIAAFYLRRRRMSLLGYLGWGLVIVLLPIAGPFLTIALAPGQPADRPGKGRPNVIVISSWGV